MTTASELTTHSELFAKTLPNSGDMPGKAWEWGEKQMSCYITSNLDKIREKYTIPRHHNNLHGTADVLINSFLSSV